MKKLLAVATIGVVGYLVVKKIKERKNNDVVEVNEEMENEEVVENVVEENLNEEAEVEEEVVGKVMNDNIEGVAENNEGKDLVMQFVELAAEIYVMYLGYKFYKLMVQVGIVKGCKIMLEKVAAYILAMLGIRCFRFLAMGK